jgi:hypothetical protein
MRSLLFAAAFVACHQEAPAKPVNVHTQLTTTITLARADYAKDSDVEVSVDLSNSTPNPIEIPAQSLDTGILLLEVTDKAGNKVPTMPPPTPREDKIKLAPGEHRTAKVFLNIFSPPLAPGEYIVGPAPSVATGNPVTFRIR